MRTPSRRTMGKTMVAIGVISILVTVAGVIVGWQVVGQVEASVDDSLVLTDQALQVVVDSVQTTSSIVATVRSGVSNVSATLETLNTSIGDTQTVIAGSTDFLGTSLPEALDAVGKVLPTIQSVAHSVDSALRVISQAPFGPDYNPAKPFDQAIGDLNTALAPLPDQLRGLAGQFDDVTQSTKTMSDQLTVLSGDVQRLDRQLGDVATLVDRYAKTAATAKVVTAQSRADLESSARSARVVLLLLGLIFAAGQIVPIWIGKELLNETRQAEVEPAVTPHGLGGRLP